MGLLRAACSIQSAPTVRYTLYTRYTLNMHTIRYAICKIQNEKWYKMQNGSKYFAAAIIVNTLDGY